MEENPYESPRAECGKPATITRRRMVTWPEILAIILLTITLLAFMFPPRPSGDKMIIPVPNSGAGESPADQTSHSK